jgi:hypothetical protein
MVNRKGVTLALASLCGRHIKPSAVTLTIAFDPLHDELDDLIGKRNYGCDTVAR